MTDPVAGGDEMMPPPPPDLTPLDVSRMDADFVPPPPPETDLQATYDVATPHSETAIRQASADRTSAADISIRSFQQCSAL